jgi:hydroxypyruvate reductase
MGLDSVRTADVSGTSSRAFLDNLFRAAIAAAHPAQCLTSYLPEPASNGRLIVLAAGKAGGSMAEVAERFYLETRGVDPKRIAGLAVARHGYGRPTRIIQSIEAGHPVPDGAGLAATIQTLDLARMADEEDLVLVLISGGASANWIAPIPPLTLNEKQALTRALLRSGAGIGEINTVRKHLSQIKGGRLARLAHPARVVTLGISDVPGDDPAVIGSGPTVPDPSTLTEARAIIERYRLDIPDSVHRVLADPDSESPKPGDDIFKRTEFHLVARPADSFRAAEKAVHAAGYDYIFLGDQVEGEAREVAGAQAKMARELAAAKRRAVIVSGGELTVTIKGQGCGGPNQEYALALAAALDGVPGVAAIAGDTDGTDGGGGSASDPAGAFVDGSTASRARALGLDPAAFLADNNSTAFFSALGDLVAPGPTFTNVNDFRAIVVDTP